MKKITAMSCKMTTVWLSLVISGYSVTWANNTNAARSAYLKAAVAGDVTIQTITNDILRDVSATNAFQIIGTSGYHLTSTSEAKIRSFDSTKVTTLEYNAEMEKPSQRFRVSIITSTNGHDGALTALVDLMDSSSNMGGARFKQFVEGPGNMCFVNKMSDPVANPLALSVIFFCRDNVAVMVVPYSKQSNILSFSRLLDTSILTLPVK